MKALCDRICTEDIQFPDGSGVSLPGQHFIQSLTCRDPSLRLTAEQALEHPWIADPFLLGIDEHLEAMSGVSVHLTETGELVVDDEQRMLDEEERAKFIATSPSDT
jgi:serine/threonine protein kinase